MQIRTIIWYHLTTVKLAITKDKRWQTLVRGWRKGDTYTSARGCKLVQSLWERSWSFLKKLKLLLPFPIPFLSIYVKEMKFICQWDISTPMFTAGKYLGNWNNLRFINQWRGKENVVHTYIRILAIKGMKYWHLQLRSHYAK